MSHITKIKIQIKSLTALESAARTCGLELRKQNTYKWYGRSVGDYPLPEGVTADQLGKCDYALAIPGNSHAYEVGVMTNPDGTFNLLWDFWQGGFGLQAAIGNDGNRLITEYTLEAAQEAAQSQGWYTERETESLKIYHPDGLITVDASGTVDASNFHGQSCDQACSPIESSLGTTKERSNKTEYLQYNQKLNLIGD
jgi:hypothetical protein